MDSIQTKIEAIKADMNNLKTACVAPGSFCNIKFGEDQVIANQHKMSPPEVTDVMKVDREVPKATYTDAGICRGYEIMPINIDYPIK